MIGYNHNANCGLIKYKIFTYRWVSLNLSAFIYSNATDQQFHPRWQ
jgi:hypothetical protein